MKLTDAQVRSMRELRADGASLKELAEWFEVSGSTVSDVCRGKTYVKAGGPVTRSWTKLTEEQVLELRTRRALGTLHKELAELFDRSAKTTGVISRGHAYADTDGPLPAQYKSVRERSVRRALED